ncbi:hypothetical protein ACFY2Q_01980 [Micromonospora sp. NPDC000316]|uniref:hypothetical protein n=1 Tax=Micromonospora sp. NPDC000316 TaxID=3364216 RepID=UPI003677637B
MNKEYAALIAQVIPVVALAIGVAFTFIKPWSKGVNPNPRGIYYVLEFGFLWLIFLAGVESYALSIVGNYDFQLNPLANKWRMSLKSDPARFARSNRCRRAGRVYVPGALGKDSLRRPSRAR